MSALPATVPLEASPVLELAPSSSCAVFDLDGTLLDGDSTGHWLRGVYQASALRFVLGLALGLLACPLLPFRSYRLAAASLLLWGATWGTDEPALVASLAAFVERVHSGRARLRWRARGLETLERHLVAGHRVVVVTGAPLLLAQALLEAQGFAARLTVLGTSLRRVAGGWGVERHCHGQEKCRYLEECGYGQAWAFAYSDSAADVPILERAEQAFLVNARTELLARLQARGMSSLRASSW